MPAGTPVDFAGLEMQAAGPPVQPKVAVSIAQVVGHHGLTFGITRCFESGQRLIQQLEIGAAIGLVEREHVERIAHAVQVAAASTQRQRGTGRLIGLGGMAQPLCAAETAHSARPWPAGCPALARPWPPLVAFLTAPRPTVRETALRRGDSRLIASSAFCLLWRAAFKRGGRRADGGLEFALARLHQRLAVQRLRLGCRGLRGLGEAEHRGRVFGSAVEVALGDEALRAQVEQIELAVPRSSRARPAPSWPVRSPARAGPPTPGRRRVAPSLQALPCGHAPFASPPWSSFSATSPSATRIHPAACICCNLHYLGRL